MPINISCSPSIYSKLWLLVYGISAALIPPLANSTVKCGDDLWMSSCCKICPKSKEVASAFVEGAWCDCGRQSYITKIINTMQANYSRANCESGMHEAEGGVAAEAENQHPASERTESPL